MKQKYCFRLLKCLVLMGVLTCSNYVANAQNFFDSSAIRQVLYKDATHAYDDAQVILLSKKRVPVLRSNLIPVQVGDKVELSTFVHYSSASSGETWKKIGATAAGLAIGSLPYLMEKGDGGLETGNDHSGLSKTVAPLVGAGIVALAFATGKRKGKSISRDVSFPKSRNGIFVPDAYLKYNLYDSEGNLLKTDYRSIDKQAKDAWQKLYLYEEVQQDGYVQIELGNGSTKPVWMDGVYLERRNTTHQTTARGFPDRTKAKRGLSGPGNNPLDTLGFMNNERGDCVSCPSDLPPGETVGDASSGGHGNVICELICAYTPYGSNCYEDCYYLPPEGGYGGNNGGGSGGGGSGSGNGGGGGGNSGPSQLVPKERTKAKEAPDRCTGLQELYYASYNEDGSFRKENSAWITEAGMILLPNDRNDTNISYNDALPTKYIEGKPHVYYDGQWLEIYGHVHTQPESGTPGNRDFEFIDGFGDDITGFVLGPNEAYRYQDDGSRIQQRIPNVGNLLGCEKSLSNYYY